MLLCARNMLFTNMKQALIGRLMTKYPQNDIKAAFAYPPQRTIFPVRQNRLPHSCPRR